MLGLGILRKKPKPELDAGTLQSVFDTVRDAPAAVNNERISRELEIGESVLQQYLDVLLAKCWIEIAYEKIGMDSIVRPFYRVSEGHNLKEVKDQIGTFMKKQLKRLKPLVNDGSLFAVRVYGHKDLNMVFDQRQDARSYKNLLANSRARLKSDIFYQSFEDGLQIEEKKIS